MRCISQLNFVGFSLLALGSSFNLPYWHLANDSLGCFFIFVAQNALYHYFSVQWHDSRAAVCHSPSMENIPASIKDDFCSFLFLVLTSPGPSPLLSPPKVYTSIYQRRT